jgi:hypothetical protein
MSPESTYYQRLKQQGLLERADEWLKTNPPPADWTGSRWAWAYTEMPVLPKTVIEEIG